MFKHRCQMKPSRRIHLQTPFLRWVQALLLAGWLLSTQGIIPAICMLAAMVDGDHAVTVRASQAGDVSVILSHEGGDGAGTPHQHDVLCRMIVAFAQKTSTGGDDHVLSFKSVEDGARTLRRMSSEPDASPLVEGFRVVDIEHVREWPCFRGVTGSLAPAWSPGLQVRAGRTILRC